MVPSNGAPTSRPRGAQPACGPATSSKIGATARRHGEIVEPADPDYDRLWKIVKREQRDRYTAYPGEHRPPHPGRGHHAGLTAAVRGPLRCSMSVLVPYRAHKGTGFTCHAIWCIRDGGRISARRPGGPGPTARPANAGLSRTGASSAGSRTATPRTAAAPQLHRGKRASVPSNSVVSSQPRQRRTEQKCRAPAPKLVLRVSRHVEAVRVLVARLVAVRRHVTTSPPSRPRESLPPSDGSVGRRAAEVRECREHAQRLLDHARDQRQVVSTSLTLRGSSSSARMPLQ